MNSRALDAFAVVIARGLAMLRALLLVFAVAYTAVWWDSWYGQHPLRLIGVAIALGWSAAYVVLSVRHALPRRLVLADVAAGVLAGLTAPWLLPEQSVGDPSCWVFTVVASAGLGAVCMLRTRWSLLALVVLAAAQFVPARDQRPQIITSTVLVLFFGVALRQAVIRLRRVAIGADAWLDAAGTRARAETVVAARARADREQERFLHDTVLNTLAGIGLGGADDSDQVRVRCARTVAQVEVLRAGSAGTGDDDLERRVESVALEARDSGLTVAVRFVADPPAGIPAARGPVELPEDVVAAVSAAVREALTNVARHAGTRAARVTVVLGADRLLVRIADDGVGFDLARPPTPRDHAPLGLSRSVHARMLDVGGEAEIDSAPGWGTRVDLRWTAPAAARGRSAGSVSLHRDYEAATRRAVGVAVLAGLALLLVPAIAYRGLAVTPAAPILLWAAMAAGAGSAVARVWRRAPTGLEATALVAFILAIVVVGAAITRDDANVIRIYNASGVLGPPMLLMLVTASRPRREWVFGALVLTGATLATDLPRLGQEPLVLVRLLGGLWGLWATQLLVITAGPVLQATAETTTRAAAVERELAARDAAAAAVRRDRARRLARIDRDVLPLLRAVADGTADARDDVTRRLCGNRARALRRMLVSAGGAAGWLAGLEPAIDAAEARGATIVLQVDGDIGAVGADVRDELLDLVSDALRAAPAARVTITLLCVGEAGRGFVSYPLAADAPAPRRATGRLVEVEAEIGDGEVCFELRWPARRADGDDAGSGPPTAVPADTAVPAAAVPAD
jgi:signal transduction histidine kinase